MRTLRTSRLAVLTVTRQQTLFGNRFKTRHKLARFLKLLRKDEIFREELAREVRLNRKFAEVL